MECYWKSVILFAVGVLLQSGLSGQEVTMLGGLLFVVCVILQFHYHDSIPWYVWLLALIAQLAALGEPAMRSGIATKKT